MQKKSNQSRNMPHQLKIAPISVHFCNVLQKFENSTQPIRTSVHHLQQIENIRWALLAMVRRLISRQLMRAYMDVCVSVSVNVNLTLGGFKWNTVPISDNWLYFNVTFVENINAHTTAQTLTVCFLFSKRVLDCMAVCIAHAIASGEIYIRSCYVW